MDLHDLYNAIAGAILGAIAGMLLPSTITRFKAWSGRRRAAKRRAVLSNNDVVYAWLTSYYEKRGKLSDLYSCKIGNFEVRIPFLFSPEWRPPAPLAGSDRLEFIKFSDSDKEFPVNNKLLERRAQMGQRIFNAPTAHVDRIESRDGSVSVHLMPCSYFEVATSIITLEEETFRAAAGRRLARTPIRDKCLNSAAAAGEMLHRPRSLGCAFVFAVKSGNSYEVLVHTRSLQTVTFGGAKGVIPNFGFEPLSFAQDSSGAGVPDLLVQNFIKEYLEELFNFEDLISVMGSRRADPLWFLELPEAEDILTQILSGKFQIEVLGLGFDALNGNAVVGALGIVDDEQAALELRRKLILNWEVEEGRSGIPDAEFVDIDSNKLEDWLRQNRYHTGAAFALSNAIPSLRARLAFSTKTVNI